MTIARSATAILTMFVAVFTSHTALAQQAALPSAPPQEIVWWETKVAEVTVGYDAALNEPRQRAIYLAISGPPDTFAHAKDAAACARRTVQRLRDRIVGRIERYHERNAVRPTAESQNAEYQDVTVGLISISADVNTEFYLCARAQRLSVLTKRDFFVSLVQRDCTRAFCRDSGTQETLATAKQAATFAAVYRWMIRDEPLDVRNQTARLLRLNFDDSVDRSVLLAPAYEDIFDTNHWPRQPLADEELATQQSAMIERLRARNASRANGASVQQLASVAALVVDATAADIIRAADVYSDPIESFILARQSGNARFPALSNELGRTRIRECRYLRNVVDGPGIAKCAGLNADEATIASCIANGPCVADLGDVDASSAMLLGTPMSIKDLATSFPLPRTTALTNMQDMKALLDACPGDAESIRLKCVMAGYAQKDSTLASVLPCLERSGRGQVASCYLDSMMQNGQSVAGAECVRNISADQAATCLLNIYAPAEAKRAYACPWSGGGMALRTCLLGLAGGDAGRIATCLAANGSKMAMALCAAGVGPDDPIAKASACVDSQKRVTTGIATCLLSSQLPPEAAKQFGCLSGSAGDPYAAGACLIATNYSLTPEQALAIQCLASTSGEPRAFASCYFGQLATRELEKCATEHFGSDNCFGPNNEIRKFTRNVLGTDIGENSVVADIVNIQLKPYTYAIVMAKPFISAFSTGYTAYAQSITNFATDLKAAVGGDAGATRRTIWVVVAGPIGVGIYEGLKGLFG